MTTPSTSNTSDPQRRARLRGLISMLVACLLFSVMNACVYAIGLCEPELPTPMVSFVRILVNLSILILPTLWRGGCLGLFGDLGLSLWLRGFFGSLALMLSFAAIKLIGPGESAFLNCSSSVFVAMLGPLVLGQKNSPLVWLAITGAMLGLALLFNPRLDGDDFPGRGMGLSSGLLAALAYLMIAKAGRKNSSESIIFYFCLVAIPVHLVYFHLYGFKLPASGDVWVLLLVGSLSGSWAQLYMTRAYQLAPAAAVGAVSYLGPVASLLWGIALFSIQPDGLAWAGCAMVLVFGVALPFLNETGRRLRSA